VPLTTASKKSRNWPAKVLTLLLMAPCLTNLPASAREKIKWTDNSHLDIQSRTIENYHISGQTVCFSHNSGNRDIHILYDIYSTLATGSPVHGQFQQTLHGLEDAMIFTGNDSDRPKCVLVNSNYE
jgi:hypothetical protein